MKNISKNLLTVAIVTASAASSQYVYAGASANVGLVSDYFFRGVDQGTSASGSAGLDYENSGFYVGTWAIDVGDGLEVDGYFGYGVDIGPVNLGVGFTGYYYTGDFDEDYEEINLTAGYGPVSIEYTIGEYDGNFGSDPDDDEYDFFGLTYEYKDFYATYGLFGQDAEGDYLEAGYSKDFGGFDAGVAFIFGLDDGPDSLTGEDESLVFSVSKTIDL